MWKHENYAYVTGLSQLHTTGDNQLKEFLTSVVRLNKTLKDTGTQYPLYCMVCNLPAEVITYLESLGIGIIPMDVHPFMKPGGASKTWDSGLIKLCTFGLTQFERVVWLDSDIEVKQNLDELFNIPAGKLICATNMYAFEQNRNERISSGIFSVKPSKDLLDLVIHYYSDYKFYADEDVLSHVPNNWVHYVAPEYNVSPCDDDVFTQRWKDKEIKVFHWIGSYKPYASYPSIDNILADLDNPNCKRKIINKFKLNTKYNINSHIEELEKSGKTCKFVSKLV